MSTLASEILEAWNRQSLILANFKQLVNESNKNAKQDPDGWPIYEHLTHIHQTRRFWLSKVDPERLKTFGRAVVGQGEEWVSIDNLDEIWPLLEQSSKAIRDHLEENLEKGYENPIPYTHPVQFFGHMIWHEGYHFGLINLALRVSGNETTEEWEEENVWGAWRTEIWEE